MASGHACLVLLVLSSTAQHHRDPSDPSDPAAALDRSPLLPLGHADGPNQLGLVEVMEWKEVATLTPAVFLAEFVHKRRPVILRGAAKSAPALQKWTEDYLIQE